MDTTSVEFVHMGFAEGETLIRQRWDPGLLAPRAWQEDPPILPASLPGPGDRHRGTRVATLVAGAVAAVSARLQVVVVPPPPCRSWSALSTWPVDAARRRLGLGGRWPPLQTELFEEVRKHLVFRGRVSGTAAVAGVSRLVL